MARSARIRSNLNTYTIVLRGTTEIFLGPQKKQMFFDSLVKNKRNTSIYAYAVTNKDAYLVVKDDDVSSFIKRITVSFARKHNLNFGFGKVFYDRYLSQPLNSAPEILCAIKNVNLIVYGGGSVEKKDYVSSYNDYFSDKLIDTSFVLNNLHTNFNNYHKEDVATELASIKKYDDQEVAEYIYNKYNILATEIHKLSKDNLTHVLTDIMKVTKASARQIARITSIPLRFMWNLAKTNKTHKETK